MLKRNLTCVRKKMLKNYILLLFSFPIILIAITIAGCGGRTGGGITSSEDAKQVIETASRTSIQRITGAVIDVDGRPIPDVQVTAINLFSPAGQRISALRPLLKASGDATSVTDDTGAFAFTLTETPPENTKIVIKATKPGYIDNNVALKISYNHGFSYRYTYPKIEF